MTSLSQDWSPFGTLQNDKPELGRPAQPGRRDALQRSCGGRGWAQPARSQPGGCRRAGSRARPAPTRRRALGLGRGSARPPEPPLPPPLPAPPGPWRLRCRAGGGAEPAAAEQEGKFSGGGRSGNRAGQPRGCLGVSRVPSPAGGVCRAARGRRCRSSICLAPRGFLARPSPRPRGGSPAGRTVLRGASLRRCQPAGARGLAPGGGSAQRRAGAARPGPPRARCLQVDARARGEASSEGQVRRPGALGLRCRLS